MKTVLFLLIGAVVVGGVAVFSLLGGPAAPENQDVVSDAEGVVLQEELDTEVKTYAGIGTLEEVQRIGVHVECTISYEAPELASPVSGTYFVSGQNVRGDFQLEIPELGGSSLSSVIFTEDMFYSWSEIAGQTYGVKMDMEAMTDISPDDRQEPIPSDVDVTYSCVEWQNVDFSIFEPPSQVLFQDVSTLMQGGMEYGTIYNEGEF